MYDISNLGDPQLLATLTIDGDVLDARLVGTQVRVATVSSPDVDAPSPVYTRTAASLASPRTSYGPPSRRTTVDDWIPTYTLEDGAGAQVSKGRLVECADLAHPGTFSGLDTVAVSSFDMESALQSRKTVGVIAGGQQIYATDASTYVATTDWSRDGSPAKTSMHKFVTAPSGASTYQGSGEVPGTLLNQYAMSEYHGVLRVASTVSERRGWANPRQVTEGVVTTLREQDGELRQLGQVGGLGREDNESIHAVRFIEERGYVVTFRQTDPLYVLDLRNAAAPKVVGELKIPGYSGYLHPIGENLLLGVGQSGLDSDYGTADSRRPDRRAVLAVRHQRPRVPPPDRHADLRWRRCLGRVRPQGVPVLAAAQPDHCSHVPVRRPPRDRERSADLCCCAPTPMDSPSSAAWRHPRLTALSTVRWSSATPSTRFRTRRSRPTASTLTGRSTR